MELDVAASTVSGRARSVRAQIVREALRRGVIDDKTRELASHTNVELVIDTGFAEILRANGKVDVTELVRPGIPADKPRASGLMVRSRSGTFVDELVGRNCGPMSIQACAVVVILEMAPGWRTMFASAADAKVCLGAVMHDPAPAG